MCIYACMCAQRFKILYVKGLQELHINSAFLFVKYSLLTHVIEIFALNFDWFSSNSSSQIFLALSLFVLKPPLPRRYCLQTPNMDEAHNRMLLLGKRCHL